VLGWGGWVLARTAAGWRRDCEFNVPFVSLRLCPPCACILAFGCWYSPPPFHSHFQSTLRTCCLQSRSSSSCSHFPPHRHRNSPDPYLTLVHRDTIIFASGSALSSARNHLPYATLIPNTIRPKKMVRISLIAYMPISVAPGLGPGAFLSPAPVFMPLLDSGSRVAL